MCAYHSGSIKCTQLKKPKNNPIPKPKTQLHSQILYNCSVDETVAVWKRILEELRNARKTRKFDYSRARKRSFGRNAVVRRFNVRAKYIRDDTRKWTPAPSQRHYGPRRRRGTFEECLRRNFKKKLKPTLYRPVRVRRRRLKYPGKRWEIVTTTNRSIIFNFII